MNDETVKYQFNTQVYEPKEHVLELVSVLNNHADILDDIADWMSLNDKIPVNPFYRSLSSKARAIALLSKNNFCTESFIISRSLIEHVVTLLYFLGANHETDVLKDYLDFAYQKVYRNIDQTISVNDKSVGIRYSGTVDLKNNNKLKQAIDKYTSKKRKKEITRWTNLTLLERIKKIDMHGKVKRKTIETMMAAMAFIYDKGSESLHATYYGCVFHLGYFIPGYDNSKNETKENYFHHSLETVLNISAALVGQVNEYLTEKKPELEDIRNRIKTNNDKLLEVLDSLRKATDEKP